MEAKLRGAAGLLPQPVLEFCRIEQAEKEKSRKARKPRFFRRAVLAAALIAALCITGFAYSERKYGLWSGMHSKGYGDVVLLNWKYNYHFPEEFLGLPFSSMSTYYGAPRGATHLEAILSPTYALHSVDYGDFSGTQMEDGTIRWSGKLIRISFGTTEIDTWKYHFSVGEDGFSDYEDVTPGSQRKVEYDGYVLYVYSCNDTHSVRWEDAGRKLVLDITAYGVEGQDEAIEIAKALIDLNR